VTPTQKEMREFQQRVQRMHCDSCQKTTCKTYADIMAMDKFHCDHCGELLPFDRELWRSSVFRPTPKSLDERISDKGRREAQRKVGREVLRDEE